MSVVNARYRKLLTWSAARARSQPAVEREEPLLRVVEAATRGVWRLTEAEVKRIEETTGIKADGRQHLGHSRCFILRPRRGESEVEGKKQC
jgi:hypothetical protein